MTHNVLCFEAQNAHLFSELTTRDSRPEASLKLPKTSLGVTPETLWQDTQNAVKRTHNAFQEARC